MASSNVEANGFFSVETSQDIPLLSDCLKMSTTRRSTSLILPTFWERASRSCRLNVARSWVISAALVADFSISTRDSRMGWLPSACCNNNDVCPRMLVSALLKSWETLRASCSAQSSFWRCVTSMAPSVDADGTASGTGWLLADSPAAWRKN